MLIPFPKELFGQVVERQVEVEDVDPGFAEDAQLAGRRLLGDELSDLVFRQVAGLGDARDLEVSRIGSDVWIEPGAGCCDKVYGDRTAGILLRELIDGALDAGHQRLVGLGQVGRA